MSRLEFKTKDRAQQTVESLYADLERRIIANPPGQCPVSMTESFLRLCHAQSCGKCVPCRLGVGQMLNILGDILDLHKEATMEDIDVLKATAESVALSSDCAIGKEAGAMVLRGIEGFREDFVEHVLYNRCASNVLAARASVPCVQDCPAGVDVPGYAALVREGRYDDAVKLIRKDNPFPTVCAHICEHPCEHRCRRQLVDSAPVNIRGLKLYAVDNCAEQVETPEPAPATGKTVAIIGGGPSGLTAAYFLALMGHKPTVYEKRNHLGGMLRYGIPNYRLPRERLNWDIQAILDTGVEVVLGYEAGKDGDMQEIMDKYDATYISIGAHTFKTIGIEGEELNGVIPAVDMLRGIGDENIPNFEGKAVNVIGGGNVAMDVARTALRAGAKSVNIVYRRRRADMTALDEEIDGAIAEGCNLMELKAPARIESDGNGNVAALVVQPQMAGEFRGGRPSPVAANAPEERLECDLIISAIGQNIDYDDFRGTDIEINERRGVFVVEEGNQSKGKAGTFVGGDCVTGPSTVINAIAAGKVAAANIDEYFGYNHEISVDVEIPLPKAEDKKQCGRAEMGLRPAGERANDFHGIEHGVSLEEALQEASRCLRCDYNGYGIFRGGRCDKW